MFFLSKLKNTLEKEEKADWQNNKGESEELKGKTTSWDFMIEQYM